ncbi:MAG: hypothetical protein KC657_15895 [Myxococcales bacterium]|nr:hypothetical protein [Myxococcales bacterium]
MKLVAAALPALLATFVACGPEAPPPKKPEAPAVASGSDVERYFPLEQGKLYHYVTREGADEGMLVAKVHRTDAKHGELRLSNSTKRFVYASDGVTYDTGIYVLRAPVAVGTSWPGEHGGTTRIAAVDVSVTVPAGTYASCVQTVEEGGRVPGARYQQTYCPGVGMVLLEATAPGAEARAELKRYGLPVKIE